MKLSLAQFRIIFNAEENKRFKGGWVQTAIDGGLDIPFKPSYVINHYGYKKQMVRKGLGREEEVEVYDGSPRPVMTPDVVLVERILTFFFLRINWNTVTKEGVRKNIEMQEWWDEEARLRDEAEKNDVIISPLEIDEKMREWEKNDL